jgi:acetamidase/formamidase
MLVENFHHDFDRDRPPVATVEDGARVTFRSWDVAWGMENHNAEGGPRRKAVRTGDGPCLCGPVAVRGAHPGRTLKIFLERINPGSWGWTLAGGSNFFNAELNRRLGVGGQTLVLRWEIADGWATSHLGQRLQAWPFPGMLGMPRDRSGSQSGWEPRVTGGNLDCRHLQAGNTLYLPIEVEGGLLSCGDGHALQADGECAGSAIECPMEATVIVSVVDLPVHQPIIETPEGWVVLGLGATLEDAQVQALDGMLDWMAPRLGLSRLETLALASLQCHLHITQVVNGVVGVQAVWHA